MITPERESIVEVRATPHLADPTYKGSSARTSLWA